MARPSGRVVRGTPDPVPDTADLDPGPRRWGQTEFVDIVHPGLPGSRSSVPAHLVEHHAQLGWVLADSEGAPPDEEPKPTVGDPDPEEN